LKTAFSESDMMHHGKQLGRILAVDLSSGRCSWQPYPEVVENRFLAGRGFAVYRLRRDVAPGTDPLGPGNVLVFSCGLLAATPAPASSRLHLCALSPLTGMLGSSNIGGPLADRMRGCGIQALVVTGRAPAPSILVVDRKGVRIAAAGALWGTDTWEAEDALRRRYGESRPAVLTIGPAGENQAPVACIVSDRDHAAGRTGLGAVMGAKNLKAVVACDAGPRPHGSDPRRRRAVAEYVRRIRQAPEFDFFSRHGGAGYTVWCSEQGFAGAYNYRYHRFDQVQGIDGKRLAADRHKSRGCPRCPVRCKAELRRSGRPASFRPEFESMINLGIKCGLSDLDALVRLDNLCTRLGLDVISAATAIAFAMDLNERGMLPADLSGGDALPWGEAAAMERLIREMADGRGLGGLLGKGVRQAAGQIGVEAGRMAPHVKGLELSGYHPGYMLGTALGYAVSSRGGDFNNLYAAMEYAWPASKGASVFGSPASVDCRSPEAKGALIRRAAILTCALDALGLCKVPVLTLVGEFDLENEARLAGALLGKVVTSEQLLAVGDRIVTLERLFNLDHGLDPLRDDCLPDMFFSEDAGNGEGPVLTREAFEKMRAEFYSAMGWDRQGIPRIETLCRLEIPRPKAGPESRPATVAPVPVSGVDPTWMRPPAPGGGLDPVAHPVAADVKKKPNWRWKR
jgi:aldehyde:ferredoxin oxidoreductase